jgi:F0F1-type ATP synthase gamma subunit
MQFSGCSTMSNRVSDLQERLERLYQLLKGLELAKDEAEAADKSRIQLKIDSQWKEIRSVEREYIQYFAQQVNKHTWPEDLAEIIVGELVDEIEVVQPIVKTNEVKKLLQEVLDELRKPEKLAAAKLKMAVPIIPGIAEIEFEGDAERVIRRLFPTFCKLLEMPKK